MPVLIPTTTTANITLSDFKEIRAAETFENDLFYDQNTHGIERKLQNNTENDSHVLLLDDLFHDVLFMPLIFILQLSPVLACRYCVLYDQYE